MYKYSKKSKSKLATCHPILQFMFNKAIKVMDITIKHGYRGKKLQNAAYERGHSTLKYPRSKHNKKPSHACDAVPADGGYQASKSDYDKLQMLIKGIAVAYDIPLTWGGDWKSFVDKPHYQLNGSKKSLDLLWENIQIKEFINLY